MIAEGSPQRERPSELDPDLRPRLRAPPGVQHHAQDAVDAEPRVPEASDRTEIPGVAQATGNGVTSAKY